MALPGGLPHHVQPTDSVASCTIHIMQRDDHDRLIGLLAEPDRLRVIAALILGARSRDEVAGATGLLAAVALLAWGREPVLALGPEARPA